MLTPAFVTAPLVVTSIVVAAPEPAGVPRNVAKSDGKVAKSTIRLTSVCTGPLSTELPVTVPVSVDPSPPISVKVTLPPTELVNAKVNRLPWSGVSGGGGVGPRSF